MDDTRDKVIALEVKVEQLSDTVERLAAAIERLTSLLDQARGAKWAIGLMLFAGGALSSYLPTVIRWVAAMK